MADAEAQSLLRGVWRHITTRRLGRRAIFEDDGNRESFVELLWSINGCFPTTTPMPFLCDGETKTKIPFYTKIVLKYKTAEVAAIPSQGYVAILQPLGHSHSPIGYLDYLVYGNQIGGPQYSPATILTYLQKNLEWTTLCPFVQHFSPNTQQAFEQLWCNRITDRTADYSLELCSVQCPSVLYRYIPYVPERLERIFGKHQLHFQSHSFFNDPFDSNMDESAHKMTLHWGMLCLTELPESVLMYSHYADSHRGLCLGFDTRRMEQAFQDAQKNVDKGIPDLRPVFYCSSNPPIDFSKMPAIYATCKNAIWAYEKEWRLVMVKGTQPQPFGLYEFDPVVITEITFGCKTSDEVIATTRRVVAENGFSPVYYLAKPTSDRFGIQREKIG